MLGLAVTDYLYPHFDAERFGAGQLTKLRAQTVSGRSCEVVAERLGLDERLLAAAPKSTSPTAQALVRTERVVASVMEAVIGACYLTYGFERTAAAVVEAFEPELENALEHPVDYKSTLQERLAQRGEVVAYEVTAEHGPPHDRTFGVAAMVEGSVIGTGSGRSKKHAEQEAARVALEGLDGEDAA